MYKITKIIAIIKNGKNTSFALPFFISILSKNITRANRSPVQKDSLNKELKNPLTPFIVKHPKLHEFIGITENATAKTSATIINGKKNSLVRPMFLIPEYASVPIIGKNHKNILKIVNSSSATSLIKV